jgi:hypothetical protein
MAPPPAYLAPPSRMQPPQGISDLGHPGRLPGTALLPDYEPMIVCPPLLPSPQAPAPT